MRFKSPRPNPSAPASLPRNLCPSLSALSPLPQPLCPSLSGSAMPASDLLLQRKDTSKREAVCWQGRVLRAHGMWRLLACLQPTKACVLETLPASQAAHRFAAASRPMAAMIIQPYRSLLACLLASASHVKSRLEHRLHASAARLREKFGGWWAGHPLHRGRRRRGGALRGAQRARVHARGSPAAEGIACELLGGLPQQRRRAHVLRAWMRAMHTEARELRGDR